MGEIERIAAGLVGAEQMLATAESCTGGLLGHLVTNQPGSSRWYVGGVVSYSNALKQALLGVTEAALVADGAVSARVAEEMARGACARFGADYALSVTGIAGPGGGTSEKPVGLVFIALATPDDVSSHRYVWNGSREANKISSAHQALTLLDTALTAAGARVATPSAAVEARRGGEGGVEPLSLEWKGRRLPITARGRTWHKEGVDHFLVMTPGDVVWELRYSRASGQWSVHSRSNRAPMV